MAVSFIDYSGGFTKTTSTIDYNAPYTIMAWCYIADSLRADGDYYTLFSTLSEAIFPYPVDRLWYENRILKGEVRGNSSGISFFESSNTVFDAWNHIALVRDSVTSISMVFNGSVQHFASSFNISTREPSERESIGFDSPGYPASLGDDHRICHQYRYDAALSLAEIQDQMYFGYPRRTANLREFLPMEPNSSRNVDFSGNARNYTETGTLTNTESLNLTRPALSVIPYYAPPPVYYASPLMLTAC